MAINGIGRPKGTPKTGGKKKGTPNKVPERSKTELAKVVWENIPRIRETLAGLEGKDFLWAIDKIMQRVLPPPQTDINVKGEMKTESSVKYKRDMAALKAIPEEIIGDIAERLQDAMQKAENGKDNEETSD